MRKFTIEANKFLSQNINAYFHCDYMGGGRYKQQGTMEYNIFSLKGEVWRSASDIDTAKSTIRDIIKNDITSIVGLHPDKHFTVCVIPRSKVFIDPSKKMLLDTIRKALSSLSIVDSGVEYIQRVKNTYTTHKSCFAGGGDGPEPYSGITIDTCTILEDVRGKEILLIDDIYTAGVNIDEDAIEALLQKGAKSVTFYSIGRTVSRY